jgi:hypothetical protein
MAPISEVTDHSLRRTYCALAYEAGGGAGGSATRGGASVADMLMRRAWGGCRVRVVRG